MTTATLCAYIASNGDFITKARNLENTKRERSRMRLNDRSFFRFRPFVFS